MANPEDTPKGQHFLLSPECRTLTVLDLAKMRDATAYDWFKRLRWPETEGKPYCPKCGTVRCHTMSRSRFKCTEKTCKAVFSVTSGTVFHARKLSFKKMLIAIWFSVNSVKGKAALQLSREIGVQYKTAWVLLMKLREAIAWRREEMVLDGQVEIDGKYAGGHIRPENKAEESHRPSPQEIPEHEASVRPRDPPARAGRPDEDGDAAWAAVRDHVSREATVFADEHGSYNDLAGLNKLQRVNHSKAYQTDDGTNTNQVESFFSRVQRAYVGIHHRFSLKYFDWYVAEFAWREDCRQVSNRGHTFQVLGKALSRPTSRYLCGYWQGNKPPDLIWEG
ncbi:IS1595 family transposase [Mycoplana dimorpha]|uniref:Transposase-like zinc ribbon protein n=1 Tax=Mycoplana dimorpha TaxID=28320 RepID=A0A2T5BH72_MYCDI|nr:IS1595 family transposase [Mycoplana dimorpha]PTM98339.1 transposase-like zinc ribbon protein [Mycoplana dimorpha]